MNNIIEYKGYHAAIEYSAEDEAFIGHVLGIVDHLSFDGSTVEELKEMFRETIDDYLEFCARAGKEPDREFKGTFNVRLSPELHRRAYLEAARRGESLNRFVAGAIESALGGRPEEREKEYIFLQYPVMATLPPFGELEGQYAKDPADLEYISEEGGVEAWSSKG